MCHLQSDKIHPRARLPVLCISRLFLPPGRCELVRKLRKMTDHGKLLALAHGRAAKPTSPPRWSSRWRTAVCRIWRRCGGDRRGQGEDDVEIGHGQQLGLAIRKPLRAARPWHFGQCRLRQEL